MNWWRRLSIVAKLPLGIGTLLLIVLGGMTVIAYVDVRRGVTQVADERLNRAASQLGGLLGNSAEQKRSALRNLARRSFVRRYLASQDDSSRAELAAELGEYALRNAVEALDVRDAEGRLLYGIGARLPDAAEQQVRELGDSLSSEVRVAIGPLVDTPTGLVYGVVALVTDDGARAGYIVERRRIASSPQTVRQLSELIGADAGLLVGNANGRLWTDLTARVEAPPLDMGRASGTLTYSRGGAERVVARATPVPGTPWILVVEFPRAPIFAPARNFLARAMLLSLILSVGGAAAGWILSRRISLPLRRVTESAELLAAGRDVEPVPVTRQDEVGRLAASFNTMASQVLQSQHELERRVKERTAALEAVNHELEAFSYSVSHDLRSPLRAIDGFSMILLQDFSAQLDAEAMDYLRRVRAAAQRMDSLISDLLSLSRLSRQELRGGTVDLSGLARSVAHELRAADSDRAVDIVVADDLVTTGDSQLLRIVLENLLGNAWKFTSRRQAAHIEFGALERTNGVRVFFVRDDGAGFDQAYAAKLFGAFQRLHSVTEFEGSGIGLATVQRIVHRHAGQVWAEGAVDEGATFYFELPAEGGE